MPENETQCRRTCRDLRPDNPETWCDGCTAAEAADRQANYERWQESTRRANVARWEAQFRNMPEILP